LEQCDEKRSEEAVKQGIHYAQITGDRYLGQAYRAAGDLRTLYPSPDDRTPEEYYTLSMESFDQARMQPGIAHTHVAQGFSYAARNMLDQARISFMRAYGIFASYNLKFKVNWVRELINAVDSNGSLPRHFMFG
ncbi:MAG TPA: hypothetical protein VHL11_03485, partial [Phototrophicaceae bacterium]|nr:hypothetical protein [Phototrophicaceae bacterium]